MVLIRITAGLRQAILIEEEKIMAQTYRTTGLERIRSCYMKLSPNERDALARGSLTLEQASSIEHELQKAGLSLSEHHQELRRCIFDAGVEQNYLEDSKVKSTISLGDISRYLIKATRLYVKDDEVRGFQPAVVCAIAKGNMYGVQVAGISAVTRDVTGAQIAGIFAIAEGNMCGVQVAGMIAKAEDVTGVQASGLAGIILGENNGLQISPIAYSKKGTGRQAGLLLWGPGNSWWNPSVFYQKIDENKEVPVFSLLPGIGRTIKRGVEYLLGRGNKKQKTVLEEKVQENLPTTSDYRILLEKEYGRDIAKEVNREMQGIEDMLAVEENDLELIGRRTKIQE